MALLLILALLVLPIIYIYHQRSKYWQSRGVNGPKSLPFFGNLLDLGKSNTKPWPFTYHEWTKKYGKYYGVQRGWANLLVISDPEMAREIMNDKFDYFHGRDLPGIAGDVDRDPFQFLFNTRGMRWRRLRALMASAFTVSNLKKILRKVDYCAAETATLIEKHADDGLVSDIHEYFQEYTIDVVSKVGLGISNVRQFDNKFLPLAKKMLHDYEDGFFWTSWIIPWIGKYLRWIQLGSTFVMKREFVSTMNMLKTNVAQRKNSRAFARGADEEKSVDFVDLFLDAEIDDTDELFTDTDGIYNRANSPHVEKKTTNMEVLANCFAFLVAGFDTTATTLSLTAYYLAKYPAIQEKMRKEIEEICISPNPSYDELMKMKYGDAVMKETLRFHPIGAGVFGRKCSAEVKVGPLIIEKGTDVTLDIFALHFDRKIWGKDVDEYRPERWLETDTLHSSFYSFGAGPRICLGMRLAFLEQQMMLTYLLRKYRIVESNEMELKISGIIMHPEKVMVRLEHLQ